MNSRLWALPGPSRFVSEVARDLDAGKTVVMVRPSAHDMRSVASAIREIVNRDWVHLDCGQLEGGGSFVQRVGRHLGLGGGGEDQSTTALVEGLDGRVLWVEPHGSTDALALGSMVAELADRRSRRGRGPVLCLLVALGEMDPLPVAGESGLVVAWWWGRLSSLDTQVVVDGAMPRRRVLGDLETVSELAGFALDVADQLARAWSGDVDHDLRGIIGHQELPVTLDAVRAHVARTPVPPRALLHAWDDGLVDWWGDHVSVHAACLLGDVPSLNRRLWRGQLASVLPFVELRRQALASWVDQRSHLIQRPLSVEDLTAAECGQLLHIIRVEARLRRSRTALNLAKALRDARNALAHLEPLDRDWLQRNESLLLTDSIL